MKILTLNKNQIIEEALKMGTLPGAVLGAGLGIGAAYLDPNMPDELKPALITVGPTVGAIAGNAYKEYQDGKKNKPFDGNSQIDRTFAGILTAPVGAVGAAGVMDHYNQLHDFGTPELLAGGATGVALGVGSGMLARKLGQLSTPKQVQQK